MYGRGSLIHSTNVFLISRFSLSYDFAIIPTIEIQQVSETYPLNLGSHQDLD